MKALVLGATGLVGRHILERLCEDDRYEQVSALIRGRIDFQHPKFLPVLCNFEKLQESKSFFNVDQVYCCLGTTIKRAGSPEAFRKVDYEYCFHAGKLAKEYEVSTFVVISAINAAESSPFLYAKTKGQLEEDLKHLNLKNLVIVRPSFLTGDRGEFRLGEYLGIKLVGFIERGFIGPFAKYKSINGDSLAGDMVSLANGQTPKSDYLHYESVH